MNEAPTLRTARLLLRPWHAGDVDALAAIKADSETMRYIGPGKTLDRAATVSLLERFASEWERLGHGRWGVEELASGLLIGDCGLVRFREGAPGEMPEVAYSLERSRWGQGFATEAASAAVAWGFANFAFPSTAGLTHPDNAASQRVLAKLGMQYVETVNGPHGPGRLHTVARDDFRGHFPEPPFRPA